MTTATKLVKSRELILRQTDEYSCGPVALYNALAAKNRITPLEVISETVKCRQRNGTCPKDLVRGAKLLGMKLERVPSPEIDRRGNYIVRLVYPTPNGRFGGHYVFVQRGKIFNLDPDEGSKVYDLDWKSRTTLIFSHPSLKSLVWKVQHGR